MTQMETKTCCKDFNCPINVVFFCRNINIGKIKAVNTLFAGKIEMRSRSSGEITQNVFVRRAANAR